ALSGWTRKGDAPTPSRSRGASLSADCVHKTFTVSDEKLAAGLGFFLGADFPVGECGTMPFSTGIHTNSGS
ncbi:MAG: hypothetical protein KGL39_59545, partial [Patescibacteria group bacterium]|nr:hypothetical protein [Patescibacteria group bacterium]